MLDFIQEALKEYAECHVIMHQTSAGGEGLRVQVDLGDGQGLQWFYITATECR